MIRGAEMGDLREILEIYSQARRRMRLAGNPDQWKNSRPSEDVVRRDISLGRSYVITESGEVAGVFAFVVGDDPTYQKIDGKWLGKGVYGTIHRIAAKDGKSGIFDRALRFCLEKADDIRIDTHEKNAAMRHILATRGFSYCGKILTDDGTERLAFELLKEDKCG